MPRYKIEWPAPFCSHNAAKSMVDRWNFFRRVPEQNSRDRIVGRSGRKIRAPLWDETPSGRDEWQDKGSPKGLPRHAIRPCLTAFRPTTADRMRGTRNRQSCYICSGLAHV